MNSNNKPQWIVVSDLDGTLLNHDSYNYQAALPAINLLKSKNIPIIFNTSKTYDEAITIRNELGIDDPFIVENGSCIYVPKTMISKAPVDAGTRDSYWEIMMGQTHEMISKVLKSIDISMSEYIRLSQCSIAEAMKITGLNADQAKQAIARDFSEPILWNSTPELLAQFLEIIEDRQLHWLRGGRFLHILGQCDKGRSTEKLKSFYSNVKTIILGDSANDADMLKTADISVIVNSPSSDLLNTLVSPVIQTSAIAPEGWNEGITKALKSLQTTQHVSYDRNNYE